MAFRVPRESRGSNQGAELHDPYPLGSKRKPPSNLQTLRVPFPKGNHLQGAPNHRSTPSLGSFQRGPNFSGYIFSEGFNGPSASSWCKAIKALSKGSAQPQPNNADECKPEIRLGVIKRGTCTEVCPHLSATNFKEVAVGGFVWSGQAGSGRPALSAFARCREARWRTSTFGC